MVNVFGINVFGQGWKGDTGYRKWNIPQGADVVITHNPPFGILDGGNTGCKALKAAVDKVKPLMHRFGHIHSDYGVLCDDESGVLYVNAASVNYQRKITKKPILVKITKKDKLLSLDVMNEEKESLFRDNAKKVAEHQNGQIPKAMNSEAK